ncbi:MAG TPA: adenosine deaminase [Acidobacteriota bacterium]|nr:adenosine deaminase [Acidobacteriota bacterium]
MKERDKALERVRKGIQDAPKAELHLHLEGSINAALLQRLARKYDSELKGLSQKELREKLFTYDDFADFLSTYKTVCQHLRQADDYLLILDHLADYFREHNIRYAEIILAPSIPHRFGFDAEAIVEAVLERSAAIEAEARVKIRWIFDCVRQWGADEARRTAEWAVANRRKGVCGLGLGGDENSLPLSEFQDVFLWARAHELFIHVHAGETGGPEQVWDALRILGANRIGHGIQAARDGRLIEYLRGHAVGLDVCLTSNQATGAWSPLVNNPFGLLFKRGLSVSLNTDDPGLFQTSLTDEFLLAVEHFDLGRDGLHRLILQSALSAFLPHGERMDLMQEFTDALAQSDLGFADYQVRG